MPGNHRRKPGDSCREQLTSRQVSPIEQLKRFLFPNKLQRSLKLTEDHILSVLQMRRARDAIFGEQLFSDPAWDILLELYAAKLGGRTMTSSQLAMAIGVPDSTSGRWITALRNRRLITSAVDESRPPQVYISLTTEGASRMEHLANHWGSAFVAI